MHWLKHICKLLEKTTYIKLFYIYLSSMAAKDTSGRLALERLWPWQVPHADEHSKLDFLQLHLFVLHSVLQLHRISSSIDMCAGGLSVSIASSLPSPYFQPQSSGCNSLPLQSCWTWWKSLKLWKSQQRSEEGFQDIQMHFKRQTFDRIWRITVSLS